MNKTKEKQVEKAASKATRENILDDFKECTQPIISKIKKLTEKIKTTKTLKIGIVTHDEPDPDAISASLGLKTIFQKQGISPERIEIFANDVDRIRLETKSLINKVNIGIKPLKKFNSKKHKLVLVDIASTQQSNVSLHEHPSPELIIDHHNPESPFESSATIITLLMTILGYKINNSLATALHIGIDTDTNNATSEKFSKFDDLAYFKILPPLIDNELRRKIIHSDLSRKQFQILKNAYGKYCVHNEDGLIIAGVGYVDKTNKGDIARVADEFLRYARKVFVIGIMEVKSEGKKTGTILHEKFVALSTRSKTGTESAGEISKKVVGQEAAGGDTAKAGGLEKLGPILVKLIEQAKQKNNQDDLERYFLGILNLYKQKILEEQTK